jgi:hypothetical protein
VRVREGDKVSVCVRESVCVKKRENVCAYERIKDNAVP